jgi:hypothetical protein
MTPYEFLKEELENVRRALDDTLRHDYGPQQSSEYFDECNARLVEIHREIETILPTETRKIGDQLAQLDSLSRQVSFIDRAKLGEFSWPFADELRRIARSLFAELDLKNEPLKPIAHVIADGLGYQIWQEARVPTPFSNKRIMVVMFPLSLKHHVLLHALFGHELGHTAEYCSNTLTVLKNDVFPPLLARGPLKDCRSLNAWLHDPNAPQVTKDLLLNYKTRNKNDFSFTEEDRYSWQIELTCDLFGLMMFGPGFAAAHKTLLEPTHPDPYAISRTHPSFAVRHKMISELMTVLGWDKPKVAPSNESYYRAECAFLNNLTEANYEPWANFFDRKELADAAAGIDRFFSTQKDISYSPLDSESLIKLVKNLECGVPPIISEIKPNGDLEIRQIHISQTLYAGWMYWLGKNHLSSERPLSFLETNQLCNHALLQQQAISKIINSAKNR